jgi:hypothetical protein
MSSHSPEPHGDAPSVESHEAGHAGHDAAGAHAPAHEAHDAAHHAVEAVEPEPEAPGPPLSALAWPVAILVIVALLVAPAAANAFARYGRAPNAETELSTGLEQPPVGATTPVVVSTPAATLPAPTTQTTGGVSEGTVIPQPLTTPTVAPASPTPGASAPVMGDLREGALRTVDFAGQTYRVEPTEIVADWKFSTQPGVASWITGTVVNYIIGLPYNAANATLFQRARQADVIRLTVANGEVLTFQVSAIQRVATTDTRVLAQDHPGVTLLLLGEPANDRMAIVGDYVPQT